MLWQSATTPPATSTFFTRDVNFNITAALDDTGAVVERYHCSAYREVTYLDPDFDVAATQESTIGNKFLYTGRRLDPETGLQYSRHRFLNLQVGRWINRDRIQSGRLQFVSVCGRNTTFSSCPTGAPGQRGRNFTTCIRFLS